VPENSIFDYIVIGGGAAGCVVASRLSENRDVSVCLLEAGGRDTNPLIRILLGFAAMVPTSINNWQYKTRPQPGLNGRIGYQPRGKTLGGSTSINAMVYHRGQPGDFDDWAALGHPGWGYQDVSDYFKRSEHNETFNDSFHGQGGPLNVCFQRSPQSFADMFVEAGVQAGCARCADFNGERMEGFGRFQVMQKDGQRCSAASAYLAPNLGRQNLRIETHARATRIIFEGKRAVGVEFLQDGAMRTLRARHELIVSGGAFNSPHLLLLSGLGRGSELQKFGIPVIHDLPGVGQNLVDHIDYVHSYRLDSRAVVGLSLLRGRDFARSALRYRRNRTGTLSSNLVECGGFVKTSPELDRPDVEMAHTIALFSDHGRKLHLGHGHSVHMGCLRPKSVGSLGLNERDPLTPPWIDPAFLTHPDDIATMVKGFKILRKVMSAPAFQALNPRNLFDDPMNTDAEMEQTIRNRADSIYHPVGTCKMGRDAQAVVDSRLCVHGVEGLRVVDASIMPTIVGCSTTTTTMMIGEKAADFILADRRSLTHTSTATALHL
jgi:choline dehydrogenase-like flavoprotein